jgi:hypothetical protein
MGTLQLIWKLPEFFLMAFHIFPKTFKLQQYKMLDIETKSFYFSGVY